MIGVNIVFSALISMMWSMYFLYSLLHLVFLGLWLFLMFKTSSGEKIVLPVIGPLAEKQAERGAALARLRSVKRFLILTLSQGWFCAQTSITLPPCGGLDSYA